MNLTERRLRLGWSIARMAVEADVPEHVIRYSEKTGARPRPENALRIADCLGTDVLDLWPIESEAA